MKGRRGTPGSGPGPASPAATPGESPAARIVLSLLRGYKSFVSPLLPPSCRFTPTCSEYAIEAVRRRGVAHGLLLAAWRLLRCHPLARGGYDPVR